MEILSNKIQRYGDTKLRHPKLFSKENSAILLVDYQDRFAPVIHDHANVIKNIKFLLAGANIYKDPIFVSEHVPDKLGTTVSELTDYLKGAHFFTKKSMSCCGSESFVKDLKSKGIQQIAVCGIEAHICVQQTCLDLIHNDFQVHLIVDAISTRLPHNKQIGVAKIEGAGGIISSVETVLFEMAYEAGNEEFKQLQKLYKDPKFVN
jgi:nicotinamidase-related amidase